jgi:hypothetical protein
MSIKFAISAFAVCVLVLVLGSRPIRAATPTASFGVSATVQASCLISATSIPWGSSPADVAQAKPISVTCTHATPYIVDLRAGRASGSAVSALWMTGPVWGFGDAPVSDPKPTNRTQAKDSDAAGGAGNGFFQPISVHRFSPDDPSRRVVTIVVTF